MMDANKLRKALAEVERFKTAANVALWGYTLNSRGGSPVANGAVRRASMDLTRALAELRRHPYQENK